MQFSVLALRVSVVYYFTLWTLKPRAKEKQITEYVVKINMFIE